MAPRSGSPYDLTQLGWFQFERLATRVLAVQTGLEELRWQGSADAGRVAMVGDDVRVGSRRRLPAPVRVTVVWVRGDGEDDLALVEFADTVRALSADSSDSLIVVTNRSGPRARQALRRRGLPADRVVVVGPAEIGRAIDRHPAIRLAVPSLLGLADLSGRISEETAAGSSLQVPAAQALARVFWPTRTYDQAREVLGRHHFVVLTGPPEMGKTAIARMISLALMTSGWEAHECTDPDQVRQAFDPGRRQVFLADDAFGSTEYRPDAGERWAAGLGRLLARLDDRHWLIWTSRPAPLKAGLARVQRERGAERFPAPGEVLVDASELDRVEKTLILFRHAKAQGLSEPARELVQWAGPEIVEHPHFTPERIRRFVTGWLDDAASRVSLADPAVLMGAVEAELASPTEAMRTSFAALGVEHRDLLIALLDAPEGLIDERELAAVVRRHHAGGLSRPPRELIDRLTDHFLRITPLGIGWVHPSWRDLVIEQLRRDPPGRRRFLSGAGVDGLILALSAGGGARGERMLPLLIDDGDWDALADRTHQLLLTSENRELARILLALQGAVEAVIDARRAREVRSLAIASLTTVRRGWERSPGLIATFLLEAWLVLNDATGELLDPPGLGPTWIDRHPGGMLLGPLGREELARVDEWLALAELLHRHIPEVLASFGFADRERRHVAAAIPALAEATTDPELHDLAASALLRIGVLFPSLREGTRGALEIGRMAESVEAGRWWVPADLSAPPTRRRVSADTFSEQDILRVLEDL